MTTHPKSETHDGVSTGFFSGIESDPTRISIGNDYRLPQIQSHRVFLLSGEASTFTSSMLWPKLRASRHSKQGILHGWLKGWLSHRDETLNNNGIWIFFYIMNLCQSGLASTNNSQISDFWVEIYIYIELIVSNFIWCWFCKWLVNQFDSAKELHLVTM